MKEVNTSKLRRTSLRADPMRLLTMLAGFDLMPGALTPTACTEEQKKLDKHKLTVNLPKQSCP